MDREENRISFKENGIEYEGIIKWSAGASGAGFHVEMSKPIPARTDFCRYYSTHEGKLRKEQPCEIAKQLMRNAKAWYLKK